MKTLIKALGIIVFIGIFINILYATFISKTVRLSKDNISFNNTLTIDNSGSSFQIKLTNIPSFWEVSRKYKTRLTSSPALNQLTFSWYTINSDTCNDVNVNDTTNLEITWTWNNTFEYLYNPKGAPCNSVITASYVTAWITPWTYNIKYDIDDSGVDWVFWTADDVILYSSSDTSILTITTNNTLSQASTIDNNNNWYIDWVKLTFSQNISWSFSNLGLTIWTLTPTLSWSYIWKVAYLNFTDWIYTSWDIPVINDSDWNIFTNVSILTNFLTNDNSKPVIKTINWISVAWVSNPIINISENAKLAITFSENMQTNSLTNNFIIKENWINITNTSYITYNNSNWNTLYYCIWGYDVNNNCNSSFNVNNNYTIEILSWANDWVWNNGIWWLVNISINILDITPPVWNIITYNWETNTAIVINWNTWNNNVTSSSNWTVNISLSWSDNSLSIDKMCLSNTLITNNSTCTNTWENYSVSKQLWSLSSSEWTKIVYVKFKDISWNISSVFSDTILWDKTWPTSSLNWWSYNNWINISLSFNCSDTLSSCNKTYYTIDWSTPNINSQSILYWSWFTLTWWTDITKTIKFFSVDSAWNIEGLTNSASFIFSSSYVTFSNSPNITSSLALTLTWTCNNSLWSNIIETSINNTTYTWVTNDTCTASNIWSNNITLLNNQTNNIKIRLQSNTWTIASQNIINDTISPVANSFIINNWDTFTSNTWVILAISATDTNWTNQMCISTDSLLINDNNCNSSTWETYSTNKNYNLVSWNWLKTLYIKFKDIAWNISNVISDSIALDSTIPILTNNTLSWTYNSSKTIILTSTWASIYYTIDWTTPTISSTIYSTGLIFWSVVETDILKAISISNAWVQSSISTNTYTFACNTVANWTTTNYPTCSITCNSWYTLSWNSCNLIVSWWWGWGWGWGWGWSSYSITPKKKNITNTWTTSTWTTNTWVILKETNTWVVINIIDTKKYLNENLTNPKLKILVNILAKKITKENIDFYISFDIELKNEYSNIISSYQDLLINLDKYLINKDKKLIPLIKESYKWYLKYKSLKNIKSRYIDNKNQIYKTKYTKLKKPLDDFEKIIFTKLKRLNRFKIISDEKYNIAIKDYNDFVLYLSIYKQYKYREAAKKALISWRKIIKVYGIR